MLMWSLLLLARCVTGPSHRRLGIPLCRVQSRIAACVALRNGGGLASFRKVEISNVVSLLALCMPDTVGHRCATAMSACFWAFSAHQRPEFQALPDKFEAGNFPIHGVRHAARGYESACASSQSAAASQHYPSQGLPAPVVEVRRVGVRRGTATLGSDPPGHANEHKEENNAHERGDANTPNGTLLARRLARTHSCKLVQPRFMKGHGAAAARRRGCTPSPLDDIPAKTKNLKKDAETRGRVQLEARIDGDWSRAAADAAADSA